MREMLFRGWDNKDKKMYYFDLKVYMSMNEGDQDDTLSTYAKDNLMQYTGLMDDKGKPIYVGDIVLLEGETAEGFYRDDYYEVIINVFNMIPAIDSHIGQMQLYRCHKICKVVGNIYENPELLSE